VFFLASFSVYCPPLSVLHLLSSVVRLGRIKGVRYIFWVFLSENSFNNSPIHKSALDKNPFLAGFKKGHFDGLVVEGKLGGAKHRTLHTFLAVIMQI